MATIYHSCAMRRTVRMGGAGPAQGGAERSRGSLQGKSLRFSLSSFFFYVLAAMLAPTYGKLMR